MVKVATTSRRGGSPRGGSRVGSGRKRAPANRCDPRHDKRPTLDERVPVHAMLRTVDTVPRLRQRRIYRAIRRVLQRCLGRADFRVIHVSIQRDHLHLIVEAQNQLALTRGMQRLTIIAARAINAAVGRRGKVFKFRYKAKQITTHRYANNVLAYVLNNWRRHREDVRSTAALDAYSSGPSFTGWTKQRRRWTSAETWEPLPVSPPRTSLLRVEWQWFGLLDPFFRPGPLEASRR
ncbi:MAG: transposase [Gemmatimonadaceae bacterium]|nr:transposase [Gemmatimonadaceae bacterium]